MTKDDVTLHVLIAAARDVGTGVVLLVRGAVVLGVPVGLDEYLKHFPAAEQSLRTVMSRLENDGDGSVFLRDVQVKSGSFEINLPGMAISLTAIDAVHPGATIL